MEGPSGYVVCIQPYLTEQDYASPKRFQASMRKMLHKVQRKLQDQNNEKVKLIVFPEMIATWLVGMGTMKRYHGKKNRKPISSTAAMLTFIFNNPVPFFFHFLHSLCFGDFSVLHSVKKHQKIDPNTGRKRLPGWVDTESSTTNSDVKRRNVASVSLMGIILAHVQRTIFKLRAKAIFKTYVKTFSELAKDYNAYIVAGSVLLPRLEWKNPSRLGSSLSPVRLGLKGLNGLSGINGLTLDATSNWFEYDALDGIAPSYDDDDTLTVTDEGLYNVSLSFNPEGRVCNVCYKTWLVQEEQYFLDSMPSSSLTAFDSPLGRVAVPICADSWFPSTYRRLSELKADIVCVPSFVTPASNWDLPWTGYSGFPEPGDVDKRDIGKKTEGEMWEKYSLPGRLSSTSHGMIGVSCFFVGRVWEMEATGQSLIIDRNLSTKDKTLKGAVGHRDMIVHRVYLKQPSSSLHEKMY